MVENSREYEIENNINDKEDYNHGDGNDSRDRRFAEGDFFLPVLLIRHVSRFRRGRGFSCKLRLFLFRFVRLRFFGFRLRIACRLKDRGFSCKLRLFLFRFVRLRFFGFRLRIACRLKPWLRLLTPPLPAPALPLATLRVPPSWSRQAG